jgi:hypothetical protein
MNGFANERIRDADFRQAVELLDAGEADALRVHLVRHPTLASRRITFHDEGYFRNPALLEFIAENPVRCGSLSANVIEVAKVILEAGARGDRAGIDSTLGLVSSGRVARECGVQAGLIELLCDYGADPNAAVLPALAHGEFEAANVLIRRGARLTLPLAAATGRIEEARHLLPLADGSDRHVALALAAQHGQAEAVGLLLDAGEDADRYNPEGCHSHSTPLHQAAFAGHETVVRSLVERGARLDIKDRHFRGTALDWANYAQHPEIAQYLRRHGAKNGDELGRAEA